MRASLRASAVLTTLLVCVPAAAEPAGKPPSSDSVAAQPLEIARVRYRQGVEAFKEGRFRDAIDLFLEADQLAPSAALSFNIAAAYEKIDQPAATLRWYRDYARRAPEAPDRAQVDAAIAKLEHVLAEGGVQQLTVSSTLPGAKLSVDGKPVGVAPWTGEIAPGAHALELAVDGHASSSRTVELPPDHAIDVVMEPGPEQSSTASAASSPLPVPAPTPRSTERAAAPRSSNATLTTLGWVGVATGGAALGGALVFELLRRSAESAAEKDRTQLGYADKLDTMYGRQTAARVLVGVGAGLAATGGVLLWLGQKPSEARTAVSVGCGTTGCVSSVRGKF